MAATAAEVAKRAGVSTSSVYQIVANPEHPRYPEATRNRVLKASREIGYVRNAAAVAMRSRLTHTIAFILGEEGLVAEETGGFQDRKSVV